MQTDIEAPISAPTPAERLMAAIRKADGANPARLDRVAEKIGLRLEEVEHAAAPLFAARRINRCDVTRKGESYALIWPSCMLVPAAPFTGADHRYLFSRPGPLSDALRAASAPRVQPAAPAPVAPAPAQTPPQKTEMEITAMTTPAKSKTRRTFGELSDILDATISGRSASRPISAAELTEVLGYSRPNTIASLVKRWLANSDGPKWVGTLTRGRAILYYDKEAPEELAASPNPANRAVSQPRAPACADYPGERSEAAADRSAEGGQEISFALWDDGHVSIYDGDELVQLPPTAVRRLALLLGVGQ